MDSVNFLLTRVRQRALHSWASFVTPFCRVFSPHHSNFAYFFTRYVLPHTYP